MIQLEHCSDFEMSVPYGAIRGKIWHHNCNDKPALDDDTVRVLGMYNLIVILFVCLFVCFLANVIESNLFIWFFFLDKF